MTDGETSTVETADEFLEDLFDRCRCSVFHLGKGVLCVEVGFEVHSRAVCLDAGEPMEAHSWL